MTKKQIISLASIFIVGFALFLTVTVQKRTRIKIDWDGNQYNIEKVNPVDAKFARPYNEKIDDLGDVFVFLANFEIVVLLAVVFFTSKDKKQQIYKSIFDVFTYGVCFFYSNSIYRLLKTAARRVRPYMYFPNASAKGIAKYDYYLSWPSGHSANAFFAFGFLTGWFVLKYPESKLKKPLIISDLLICVTTMVLRMLSGNHFLTDVISGATIGFVTSYVVFWACNKIYTSK